MSDHSSHSSHLRSEDPILATIDRIESNLFGAGVQTELDALFEHYNRIRSQPTAGQQWLPAFFSLMKNEWTRLRSFYARLNAKWSLECISPDELASAGFFFLHGDRVQCAFCRGVVFNWQRGDRPLVEHIRHFPLCPFVMGDDVGNQPIKPFSGYYGGAMVNKYLPPKELNRFYGIQVHVRPEFPNYKTLESRRRSFFYHSWHRVPISTESLAEAGFFAFGSSDQVRCFYCNGGLFGWEVGDEPWVEHAKWFPECYFVRLNKSQAFIQDCRIKKPQHLPTNSQTVPNIEVNSDRGLIRPQNSSSQTNGWVSLPPTHQFNTSYTRLSTGRDVCGNDSPFGTANNLGLNLEDLSIDIRFLNSNNDESDVNRSTNSLTNSSNVTDENEIKNKNGTQIKLKANTHSQLLCKICFDSLLEVVFLPCGHQACVQCTACLTNCHICRASIRAIARTYFV